MLYFISNKNKVISKGAIAEHLWGDNMDMADNYDFIYTHIKNLRKKLMQAGAQDYIKSVYGMGYKFSDTSMKLFTRYFRINLLATLLIFLLASIAFYFLLWWVMINQVDEDLKIEQREIETYVSKYHHPPEPITVKDQRSIFRTIRPARTDPPFQHDKITGHREREDFQTDQFHSTGRRSVAALKWPNHWRVHTSMNRAIIIVSLLTVVLILLIAFLLTDGFSVVSGSPSIRHFLILRDSAGRKKTTCFCINFY